MAKHLKVKVRQFLPKIKIKINIKITENPTILVLAVIFSDIILKILGFN